MKTPIYTAATLLIIVPFIYLVILSFMTRGDVWGYKPEFTFDNYLAIIDPLYISVFIDSFKLALTVTPIVVLIGYPFGYIMGKTSAAWKRRLMIILMIPFWISGVIRLYGW